MEPITEQRQVPSLVVYGYLLLMTAASPSRRAALTRALAGYCDQHELLLAAVFTDNGVDGVQAPGFTGLLEAMSARTSYGLVVPTRAHLGPRPTARQRLTAIAATGRRLMIVRDASVCAVSGPTW
jgi:hypothetical protein